MRIMPRPSEVLRARDPSTKPGPRQAEERQPWGYWLNVAREHGISAATYNTRRYKYGWPVAKAAMHPVQQRTKP